jgi:hypothetical protein
VCAVRVRFIDIERSTHMSRVRFRAGWLELDSGTVHAEWHDSADWAMRAVGYAMDKWAGEHVDKCYPDGECRELCACDVSNLAQDVNYTPQPADVGERATWTIGGREWFVIGAYDPDEAITPEREGPWVAGASSRSADRANQRAHEIAEEHGMYVSTDDHEWMNSLTWEGSWVADPDDAERLTEMATAAVDYLNEHAPEGWVFRWDDGLYMLPVCAWEDFEPQHEECPHAKIDCPNK